MANVHRFRFADARRERQYSVDTAQVIEVGDQVYLEVDDVRAVSQITYGSLVLAQERVKKQFVGIAMQASANGDTDDIRVAAVGIFEMNCAAAQFEIGDVMGPDDNAGATALEDQEMIALGEQDFGRGIARVARRYSANTTRVLVEIFPVTQGPISAPQLFTVFQGLITGAVDLVTDWTVPFPFKLLQLKSTVTVLTVGAGLISVHNGATALDDTQVIPTASAIGAVVTTAMDDASGDDIFNANDTLSIISDGVPTAGELLIQILVQPFFNES